MNDPRVAVEHPVVRGWHEPFVVVPELLQVTCSDCGDLTDYCNADDDSRHRLQRIAREHSDSMHDGLVDAVGWVR